MSIKQRKLITLFALTHCYFSSGLFATEANTQKVPYAVAPAKNPVGDDTLPFYIQGAYTFWVPYQEGLNIAYSGNNAPANNPGNIIRPIIEGANGFKVGLGANTMHDGWMIRLNYAWFNNSPQQTANTLDPADIYAATFETSSNSYSAISSKWTGQFNRVDAKLDRSFFAGHYLTLCPWLGLLGTWETQNLSMTEIGDDGNSVAVSEEVRWQQNWWGIGPYAGCEASYFFTDAWALYISSGASLLVVNHELYQKEYDTLPIDPALAYSFNQVDNFYNVEPMIETSLGLRWESAWTNCSLCIDLSWELQTYFSHNGFQAFFGPMGVMGNYSMQGATASAKISF